MALQPDAPVNTVEQAAELVESWCAEIGPVGNTGYAPTGDPYMTIVSGGIKPEGDRLSSLWASPDHAITAWLRAVSQYTECYGTLYWREKPTLEQVTLLSENYNEMKPEWQAMLGKHTFWFVWARLLITDKPAAKVA